MDLQKAKLIKDSVSTLYPVNKRTKDYQILKNHVLDFLQNDPTLREECTYNYGTIKKCFDRHERMFMEGFADTIGYGIPVAEGRSPIYRDLNIRDYNNALDIILSENKIGSSWSWDDENNFCKKHFGIPQSDPHCIKIKGILDEGIVDFDESLVKNLTTPFSRGSTQQELVIYGDIHIESICQASDWKCISSTNVKNIVKPT